MKTMIEQLRKTRDEIEREMQELNAQMRGLRDQKDDVESEITRLRCVYQIGDRVEKQGVVYEISRFGPNYTYGHKIRKNGELYVCETALYGKPDLSDYKRVNEK